LIIFDRQIVGQLCGWSNVDPKSGGYDRMGSLLEQNEYEKVAAIYIFQMNVNRALDVLNQGYQEGLCFTFHFYFFVNPFFFVKAEKKN
jgi:hypothetical protein